MKTCMQSTALALLPSHDTEHQRHKEDDDEYEEQNLCNAGGTRSDTSESKHSRNDRNDKENQSVVKHGIASLYERVSLPRLSLLAATLVPPHARLSKTQWKRAGGIAVWQKFHRRRLRPVAKAGMRLARRKRLSKKTRILNVKWTRSIGAARNSE
jgi:hypothetical protein